jgi:hypothetical protein
MMIHRALTLTMAFMGIAYSSQLQASAQQQTEFSVYCSSNMDGTGKCRRDDNSESLTCLIIPGGVIACRDNKKSRYECVQYGAVLANQTQFSCVRSSNNRINDQLFNDTQSSPDTSDPGGSLKPSADTKPLPRVSEPTKPMTPAIKPPASAFPSPFVDDTASPSQLPGSSQDFNRAF